MQRTLTGLSTALLLWALPAHGSDPVAAETLFRAGREAADRREWSRACDLFAESNRLDPAPGTLLNLGECSENTGKVASAWRYFLMASDQLGMDPRAEIARERVAALERRMPRLTLRLPKNGPRLEMVLRDGTELGPTSLGTSFPVDPGPHAIRVRFEGFAERVYELTVAESQQATLVLEPGMPAAPVVAAAAPAAAPPVRASGAPTGSSRATIGWFVGGLGAASIGVGAITGVLTLQRRNTYLANCTDGLCNETGMNAASQGRALSTVSTVTFITGLAAMGAGAWLILSSPSPSAEARPGAAVSLHVGSTPLGGLGAACTGSF